MRLGRGKRADVGPADAGTVRIDKTAADVISRLSPGDVALFDMTDIDRASAHALVAAQPLAVLNMQSSMSGRYPSEGPVVLAEAGIAVIDNLGSGALAIEDGSSVRIDGGTVIHDGTRYEGRRWELDDLKDATERAREHLPVQLRALSTHAFDIEDKAAALVLTGHGAPPLESVMKDTAVVVGPGHGFESELRRIRRYLRDHRPTLVALGRVADRVADAAYAPDVIVGDIDAVSDKTLSKARFVVMTRDESAVATRVETLDVDHDTVESELSDDDLALVAAFHGGATSIVTVGIPTQVIDLLERHRSHVAGTVVTRLQVGHHVIDASALASVYRHRYPWWGATLVIAAGLAALGAAIWIVPGGRPWLEDLWDALSGLWGGA